jgi:RimJ/RimL family protein N-acetyltransferase
MTDHDAHIAYQAYLDAISATMQCEMLPDGTVYCRIPVLHQWEAIHATEARCRNIVDAQIITWIARCHLRGEPLPPFAGITVTIADVVEPEIHTKRLRLVPYTTTLRVAAAFDQTRLATLLGTVIADEWPYPHLMADDDDEESVDDQSPAVEADPPTVLDLLDVSSALYQPADQVWSWLIIHQQDNRLIGDIGTTNPPRDAPDERSMQIGYSLVPEYQRHGYMTEAARAYVAWAFTHPELEWIFAATQAANVASRRVLEKLGGRIIAEDTQIHWLDWAIWPDAFHAALLLRA